LNFSSIPKWHVLLSHAADQLEQMDGFADMGEDSIERNHQSREKDRHQNSHLRHLAVFVQLFLDMSRFSS
jgi:hypothetical protein